MIGRAVTGCLTLCLLASCQTVERSSAPVEPCDVEFIILGTGQDGGAPQIHNHDDPGWNNADLKLLAASGALVDHRDGSRFLFEATPDIREQLYNLEQLTGPAPGALPMGLSGVFLTHAHIGHYAGLIFAGHESAGAKSLPVYAMPRMADYLSTNGPWDQMVRFENIIIHPLSDDVPTPMGTDMSVTPLQVPHRDEYSETVGFVIQGSGKRVLFLPDIDDWDLWESRFDRLIEDQIAKVDVAYLDATFFDNGEIPGRDMSSFPHPRLSDSIARFSNLPESEQRKIRFFHFNHTNTVRDSASAAARTVRKSSFHIAQQGERVCLD